MTGNKTPGSLVETHCSPRGIAPSRVSDRTAWLITETKSRPTTWLNQDAARCFAWRAWQRSRRSSAMNAAKSVSVRRQSAGLFARAHPVGPGAPRVGHRPLRRRVVGCVAAPRGGPERQHGGSVTADCGGACSGSTAGGSTGTVGGSAGTTGAGRNRSPSQMKSVGERGGGSKRVQTMRPAAAMSRAWAAIETTTAVRVLGPRARWRPDHSGGESRNRPPADCELLTRPHGALRGIALYDRRAPHSVLGRVRDD
jgi:hypothetical protein